MPYLLPKLLHDDIDELLLNVPWLVHGAEVRCGHTVGHDEAPRAVAGKTTTCQ